MFYKTRYGEHYHANPHCIGSKAVFPCGTEKLDPCQNCVNQFKEFIAKNSQSQLKDAIALYREKYGDTTLQEEFEKLINLDGIEDIAGGSLDDTTQDERNGREELQRAQAVFSLNSEPVSQEALGDILRWCLEVYSHKESFLSGQYTPESFGSNIIAEELSDRIQWLRDCMQLQPTTVPASVAGESDSSKTHSGKGEAQQRERRIQSLFSKGTSFECEGHSYTVQRAGKPRVTHGSGEPKTDIFIEARDEEHRLRYFKISYKMSNAGFGDNHIRQERLKEIAGSEYQSILNDYIQEKMPHMRGRLGAALASGTLTLGWELMMRIQAPSSSDALTSQIPLPEAMTIEAYSGRKTAERFANADVAFTDETGNIEIVRSIPESGIAEYMCVESSQQYQTAQEVIDALIPIEDFAVSHPLYLGAKAVNYHKDKHGNWKWDSDRPFVAYVDYYTDQDEHLKAHICSDAYAASANIIGEQVKSLFNDMGLSEEVLRSLSLEELLDEE